MTINETLNYLQARQSLLVLSFSDTVTTANGYLKGAGGVGADGFPMPHDGLLLGLQVFDGSSLHEAAGSLAFSAGDRIAVYANYFPVYSTYNVYIRKNGVNQTILVQNVQPNTNLLASVVCRLTE